MLGILMTAREKSPKVNDWTYLMSWGGGPVSFIAVACDKSLLWLTPQMTRLLENKHY